MNVLITNFNGVALRYALVSDNGVLFNTRDVCWTLKILENTSDGILNEPCLNIAGAINAALSDGVNNMPFVEWLEYKFLGYDIYTPLETNCDEEWKPEQNPLKNKLHDAG